MRCPWNLLLKVSVGIMPVLIMGCSNASSGSGPKAGATVAVSTNGTSITGGAQPDAGGGAPLTGGETGSSSSTGGKTGGVGSLATTATGGTAGSGGALSSSGGSRTGSTDALGGGGGSGGISTMGGAVAGQTSSVSSAGGTFTGSTLVGGTLAGGTTANGDDTSGSSVTGGITATGGSRSSASNTATSTGRTAPPYPARFVGNIDTNNKAISADFAKYWDQFTPENIGKWGSVQGQGQDTFTWSSLDASYKYAEENDIVFKEHSFIWGAGEAFWLNNDNIVEAAKTWMKTFCERYPKTRLIDVVNEPLHVVPGYAQGLRQGGTGYVWIANVFKMAREACPNAILILNDYNQCEYANENQRTIDLVATLRSMDAPIDAIGCESHDAAKVPVSKFKGFMDKIASDTGLPIYITEFDIGLADDEQQRAQYADYFTMFWDDPAVKGATIWGYIVNATWRANTGIMTREGTMRPAMTWLMNFLKR
jgi:endo-1,4-beta-xylanase